MNYVVQLCIVVLMSFAKNSGLGLFVVEFLIYLGTAERFMDFTVRQCVVHLFVKVHMGERLMDFTMDSGPKDSSRSTFVILGSGHCCALHGLHYELRPERTKVKLLITWA